MNTARYIAITASLSCVGLCAAPPAMAQGDGAYPTRRIIFVLPSAPGAGSDFPPRFFSDRISKTLGQPVIVENRPGASWIIGTEHVTRQPADGYTILYVTLTHVLNPNFFRNIPYDPITDFTPIVHALNNAQFMTVNAAFPAKSVSEFIEYARERPGKLNFGSVGMGSTHHLGAELFQSMAGVKMFHVPFKGGAQITQALVAGQVDVTFVGPIAVTSLIQAGKLRALGTAGSRRSMVMPEVPTIAEAGPLPGFSVDSWQGIVAKAGTPAPIVARLNREFNAVLRDPRESGLIRDAGYDPAGGTPEAFMQLMKNDAAKWAKIIKEAGIKPE